MAGQQRTPGLTRRGSTWWVNKKIRGIAQPIRESTGTSDLAEAERYLARRIEQLRHVHVYGERPPTPFRDAVTRYLEEVCPSASLERAAIAFEHVLPTIGATDVTLVHDGLLAPYRRDRMAAGASAGTVNKEMMFVSRVLNLCARVWRHVNGRPWIDTAPLIQRASGAARQPTILPWEQQGALLAALPGPLAKAALFDLHTGLRAGELSLLAWAWEVKVPELDVFVFVLPREVTKAKQERVVVLNSVARRLVEGQRGNGSAYVFPTDAGKPYVEFLTPSWVKARMKIGLPSLRFHDLRHTFGHRLRGAGVGLEDREDLLGHTTRRMTTHYSAPELHRLLEAAEKIVTERPATNLRAITTAGQQR